MKILLIWFCFFIRSASQVIYSSDLDSVFVSTQHNVKCYGSIKNHFCLMHHVIMSKLNSETWNAEWWFYILNYPITCILFDSSFVSDETFTHLSNSYLWCSCLVKYESSFQFINYTLLLKTKDFCCNVCNMYVASFNKKFQFPPCATGIVKIHNLE